MKAISLRLIFEGKKKYFSKLIYIKYLEKKYPLFININKDNRFHLSNDY